MTMAAITSPLQQRSTNIETEHLKAPQTRFTPSVIIPQPASGHRSGHLNLNVFSPVNQNGSFEFDRVLKSGDVYKRTKTTKQWKKLYLVLRPNLLSAYKSSSEERLHKQISLSELNAVAHLKDPKGRREHLFALYTPSRNYHFQAVDQKDAQAWVELIRREASIDENGNEIPSINSAANDGGYEGPVDGDGLEQDRLGSSSPEPVNISKRLSTTRDGVKIPGIRRPATHDMEYSGDDLGAFSDWSDTPQQSSHQSGHTSFVHHKIRGSSGLGSVPVSPVQQSSGRNASRSSGFQIQDEERVIWQGYLLSLKSKGGVRQWKRIWVVLRPKNLAFYKNDEEYAAQLILPLSNIINAVEVDPLSRSKPHCMQIIAEDKTFRFAASSEEGLARWLGALKSQLARRNEAKKNPEL